VITKIAKMWLQTRNILLDLNRIQIQKKKDLGKKAIRNGERVKK
jgi:hypothetical protein